MEFDAAIIFAPAGQVVPVALRAVRRGGTVVCAGIHMSPIPELPYELLWGERVLRSVANLTRTDGHEFVGPRAAVPNPDQRSRSSPSRRPTKRWSSSSRVGWVGTAVLVP